MNKKTFEYKLICDKTISRDSIKERWTIIEREKENGCSVDRYIYGDSRQELFERIQGMFDVLNEPLKDEAK